jgi:hypothetical protein
MTFVGCDLHTRTQHVAVLDTDTGEAHFLVAGLTRAWANSAANASTRSSGRGSGLSCSLGSRSCSARLSRHAWGGDEPLVE